MGTKERVFSPLPHDVSLEDLVPKDNFYRRLEETLDLSFVRELVRPLYAKGGRPSVEEGYVLRETAAGTGNQLLYFCTRNEDLAYAAFLRELSGSGRQAFGNAA